MLNYFRLDSLTGGRLDNKNLRLNGHSANCSPFSPLQTYLPSSNVFSNVPFLQSPSALSSPSTLIVFAIPPSCQQSNASNLEGFCDLLSFVEVEKSPEQSQTQLMSSSRWSTETYARQGHGHDHACKN